MATKTVYQYDLAGLYQNPTQADESPLEPGVYHIPARCTEIPPRMISRTTSGRAGTVRSGSWSTGPTRAKWMIPSRN